MLQLLTRQLAARIDRRDETGATAVEYGLMVALIAAVIILVVTALGADVLEAFDTIENGMFGNDAGAGAPAAP